MNLDIHGTLLLNADLRPLTVWPLSTLSYKDAVRHMVRGEVNVLASSGKFARSPSRSIELPSVVALRRYVTQERPVSLSRWNLFLAHDMRCCYCGGKFSVQDLTFDHVVPRSRGGTSTWANLVPACEPCNARKRDRTPAEAGMALRRTPFRPNRARINAAAIKIGPPPNNRHEWRDWLYWTVPVDP